MFFPTVVTLGIEGAASRNVFEGDSTDVCVSKDIQTVRPVNFLLTPIPGSAERTYIYSFIFSTLNFVGACTMITQRNQN